MVPRAGLNLSGTNLHHECFLRMTRRVNYREVIHNLTGGGSIRYWWLHTFSNTTLFAYNLNNGAQGRNRTGTPVKARDFRTTIAFTTATLNISSVTFVVWTFSSPCCNELQVRQEPSSLYTFNKMIYIISKLSSGLPSALPERFPRIWLHSR